MTDYKTLNFEVSKGVAHITLNRPESANGINIAMGLELLQSAIYCDETPAIRAVLITGNGKMFSAGGDLKSFAAAGEQMPHIIKELTIYLHGAISRFARMDAPVIIAVNGMAAGAGFSLAVSGDLVIATGDQKIIDYHYVKTL